jgi:prolyl-tRNA synthetase
LKTLVFWAGGDPVLAVVPGDRELNEAKLSRHLGGAPVRLASAGEIEQLTGGPMGFTGPVELETRIRTIWDPSVQEGKNWVAGGNKKDVHLVNVRLGRDVAAKERADVATARRGDRCPRCGDELTVSRGIEVGHIFKLGARYSEPMKARFLDPSGAEKTIIMGTYGIGITRTVAAVIEQSHDENGIVWPMPVAPFHVHVLAVNQKHEASRDTAATIAADLESRGVEVLLDDRDERPGAKFKDADLLGMPLRVTVGERGLAEGVVELRDRKTGTVEKVPTAEAAGNVATRVQGALED